MCMCVYMCVYVPCYLTAQCFFSLSLCPIIPITSYCSLFIYVVIFLFPYLILFPLPMSSFFLLPSLLFIHSLLGELNGMHLVFFCVFFFLSSLYIFCVEEPHFCHIVSLLRFSCSAIFIYTLAFSISSHLHLFECVKTLSPIS